MLKMSQNCLNGIAPPQAENPAAQNSLAEWGVPPHSGRTLAPEAVQFESP